MSTITTCRHCGGTLEIGRGAPMHVPPFAGGTGALKDENGHKCRRPEP